MDVLRGDYMELFIIPPFDVELTKGVSRHDVGDVAGSYDENAHKFGARLFRNGEEVDISECTVSGYFIRPGGYTVTLHGTVEDGIAWVTLNKSCYYYDGAFTLAVKVSDVGIGTVLVVDGRIIQTRTDSIVDEENTIPSLEEIYSSIDRVEKATAAANEAAENASKTPFIGDSGYWYFWDAERGMYVDSENRSIPEMTFQVQTGEPGTDVQMVQTGTDAAPVITLTIPRGDTGAVDGIDYYTGSPKALGTASPGTANGVARGDHVHPMPGVDDLGAVSYNAQTLTDEQKQQARENIGAGEPYSYSLPTATADELGGVKLGGAFTAPDGVLTIEGEPAEMVLFIEEATYSKNATVQTLVPFDEDAFYIGSMGGSIPTAISLSNYNSTTKWMRFGGVGVPGSGYLHSTIDSAIISFESGATTGTLFYINKFQINASTDISNKEPTSAAIGPVWMLRKIAQ